MTTPKPNPTIELIAETSTHLWNAWLEPLSAMQRWNVYWGERWGDWLKSVSNGPNVWLPALSRNVQGQSPRIDFFLPWLPQSASEIRATPSPVGEKDATRVLLRAAVPHVGAPRRDGEQGSEPRSGASVAAAKQSAAVPAVPSGARSRKKGGRPKRDDVAPSS